MRFFRIQEFKKKRIVTHKQIGFQLLNNGSYTAGILNEAPLIACFGMKLFPCSYTAKFWKPSLRVNNCLWHFRTPRIFFPQAARLVLAAFCRKKLAAMIFEGLYLLNYSTKKKNWMSYNNPLCKIYLLIPWNPKSSDFLFLQCMLHTTTLLLRSEFQRGTFHAQAATGTLKTGWYDTCSPLHSL